MHKHIEVFLQSNFCSDWIKNKKGCVQFSETTSAIYCYAYRVNHLKEWVEWLENWSDDGITIIVQNFCGLKKSSNGHGVMTNADHVLHMQIQIQEFKVLLSFLYQTNCWREWTVVVYHPQCPITRYESILLSFFFPAILFKSTYYPQYFVHSIPSLQKYLCVLLEYFVTGDCSIRVYWFS